MIDRFLKKKYHKKHYSVVFNIFDLSHIAFFFMHFIIILILLNFAKCLVFLMQTFLNYWVWSLELISMTFKWLLLEVRTFLYKIVLIRLDHLLIFLKRVQNRNMPSADSFFQKSSLVSRDLLFLLQKAPSIRPLSFFSYEVNRSGALLAKFDKKNQFQINSWRNKLIAAERWRRGLLMQ